MGSYSPGRTSVSSDFTITEADTEGGLIIDNTATDGDPAIYFKLDGTTKIAMGIEDNASDRFVIATSQNSSTGQWSNIRAVIDTDGNFGISNSAPITKLDVGGSFTTGLVTLVETGAVTAATHAGRTLLLGEVDGNAECAITLPAATGTGDLYRFVVSVVNTSSYIIKVADATDTIDGSVTILDVDGTNQAGYAATGADDTITLNGATTGGVVGDWVEFADIATNQWAVRGHLVVPAGSDIADPFSATVS